MTYETLQKLLAGILALYFVVSFAVRIIGSGEENLYPFFSWSLYAWVPARVEQAYDLELTQVRGEALAKPTSLLDLPGLYLPRTPTEVRSTIAEAGERIRAGENPAFLSQLFSYLPASSYRLVELTYNPVSFWTHGDVLGEKPLTTLITTP